MVHVKLMGFRINYFAGTVRMQPRRPPAIRKLYKKNRIFAKWYLLLEYINICIRYICKKVTYTKRSYQKSKFFLIKIQDQIIARLKDQINH